MKKMTMLMTALFLSLGSFCYGEVIRDYSFEQERMMIAEDGIYIISSFDHSDGVTAYAFNGTRLWETSFHAKITSWRIAGDYIVVFSKHRSGHKTYLTCMDRYTGKVLWERP